MCQNHFSTLLCGCMCDLPQLGDSVEQKSHGLSQLWPQAGWGLSHSNKPFIRNGETGMDDQAHAVLAPPKPTDTMPLGCGS